MVIPSVHFHKEPEQFFPKVFLYPSHCVKHSALFCLPLEQGTRVNWGKKYALPLPPLCVRIQGMFQEELFPRPTYPSHQAHPLFRVLRHLSGGLLHPALRVLSFFVYRRCYLASRGLQSPRLCRTDQALQQVSVDLCVPPAPFDSTARP